LWLWRIIILCNYGKLLYGVRYGAKLALPVQKWPQKGLSTSKSVIFAPRCAPLMCWRRTMLPWMTPRLGWGCISLGAGTASAKLASERHLRPKHLPFPPTACSSYVLAPHNATLNDPEAGLGLHQLGGRAQQRLAWKLKVGRSTWLLVVSLCFIHKELL